MQSDSFSDIPSLISLRYVAVLSGELACIVTNESEKTHWEKAMPEFNEEEFDFIITVSSGFFNTGRGSSHYLGIERDP